MVNDIEKKLRKVHGKREIEYRSLVKRIREGDITGLHAKKIKGHSNRFRIRKGRYRIVFEISKDKSIEVISFGGRSEKTYRS